MKLIRLPEVMSRVGLGRTAIYALIKLGAFPAPVKQGTASHWPEPEIDAYQARLMSARQASWTIPASS